MLEIEEELDLRLLGLSGDQPVDKDFGHPEDERTGSTNRQTAFDNSGADNQSADDRPIVGDINGSVDTAEGASVKAVDYATISRPKARLARSRLPGSRRSRPSIRLLAPRAGQMETATDTEAQGTDTTATDTTATDTDDEMTARILSLHPQLRSLAEVIGIENAQKIEARCREFVPTGYPLPGPMRDLFPSLDDLYTAVGYTNALRYDLSMAKITPTNATRVKLIRQIAQARQEIYLTAFRTLLLPNAPSGGDDPEPEPVEKIELTNTNLEILGKTLPKVFPKDKSNIKTFMPLAMGERAGKVVWEYGVGRVVDGEGGFRGKINEGAVHVFVDHSNILYGLLTHLYPSSSTSLPPRHLRTLSLPCLSLLLRRGRPTPPGTLHLVASSPLKQDLDPAVRLGFEVSVLKRVEIPPEEVKDDTAQHLQPRPIQHHVSSRTPVVSLGNVNGIRRYKEQGVDEILHLKILQTLNAQESGTIVLATGDARGGQFNRDGFLGAVREALKRGWNVELWSWSEGLSRMWRDIAKRERWGGEFTIHLLDDWAEALVEVDHER